MKPRQVLALGLLVLSSCAVAARHPVAAASEPPRTAFVQLFEWPWKSVAQECETFLGPNGFAAVQVSPPNEHINLGHHAWWERYQPVSYKLESRSGSEQDFEDMIRRCKAVGVGIYVDVVFNHMTASKVDARGFAGTPYQHYNYPGLYGAGDFHHCGQVDIDYNSAWSIQNCELLGIADLNTGSAPVQEKIASYLRMLIDKGAAGLRIDAAKHISAEDLAGIYARIGRNPFIVQEVITGPGEPVAIEPYARLAHVDLFPWAYGVGMALRGQDLGSLLRIPSETGVPSERAVTLLENHDLERRPTGEAIVPFVGDRKLHDLGLVYQLTFPYGYPQLYSGYTFENHYDRGPPVDEHGLARPVMDANNQCQAPWTCAHREPIVRELVHFRNHTSSIFAATDIAQPRSSLLAFGRGHLGHVVMNAGHRSETVRVPTRLRAGRYCNLLDAGQCAEVDGQGMLQVTVNPLSSFVVEGD